ncbi:MAG: xenobiotic-transporting ATPase [Deltaproteobacteria bacterium RBG_16_50_11]|nr:MAG: xenobiotic-transporting ATPase [Deltaproteobacteria bacterium RBG_16_50_11]
MAPDRYSDIKMVRRLFSQVRVYWPHIAAIFFVGVMAIPLALLLPVPLKIAVDSVVGSSPLPEWLSFVVPASISGDKFSLLLLAVCMQVLVVLFIQLQSLLIYVLQTYAGEGITLLFRERLFRHVQRLSFSFLDSRGTADSIYRIQYDAPSFRHIIIHGLIPLITAGMTLLAMIYVIARINVPLALVALGVSPFLYGLSRVYNTRMRPQYKELMRMESSNLGIVQEVLTSFRVVKAFGREESEQKRFTHHSGETVRAQIRLSFLEGSFGLLVNVVIGVGTASVLLIGIRNIQAGMLTLGEMLMVTTYLSQIYGPLRSISKQVANLQSYFARAQRAFDLLDEIPDVMEKPSAMPLRRATGSIEFRDVSFSYDGKHTFLEGISFRIGPGTKVGIAGKTGVGKTTLVSLLTRFYDPGSGAILLDDVDLRDYKLTDLRAQFAIVLQEPVLFSTSVVENIAYGRPEAGKEKIVAAAKAANAHDFIRSLPDGYDTIVGERGMCLSGGERQRIALARAFLKDAPILILDEPTSSVDTGTEVGIMEAMERLMKGRTTFIISHRLGPLKNCDILIVLEEGKITKSVMDVDREVSWG